MQVNGELIPKEEYVPETAGPMVMSDIKPYKSMVTGEMIGSRSTHRAHLRQHGLIEVGSEKMTPRPTPMPDVTPDILRAMQGRNYAGR